MVRATINDYPILGSKEVSWPLRSGVRPVIQAFDMVPEHADILKELAKTPVTLKFGDLEVQFLYVLNAMPGENPHIKRVVLADRRWLWTYKTVRKFYNIRRNVGVRRIEDPASPPENLTVTPKVYYQKWTLENQADGADPETAKWDAGEVINDVFNVIASKEEEWSGFRPILGGIGFALDASLRRLPVEELRILDQGDRALERALAYMPELDIYCDYGGSVIVYSKTSGDEKGMLEIAGPAIVGQGFASLVDNSTLRPSKVRVFFSYEVELRVDADERSVSRTADSRYAENVAPIPDFSLTVNNELLCQGTYETFTNLFSAWPAPPGFGAQLTHDLVQKAMVPYMDLWAGIELSGYQTPDADWSARVATINRHYRRTYKIQRHIMDKLLAIKPYRISTVNQATGTRAPALAYADFCLIPGQRALFNEARNASRGIKDLSYAVNVKAHPALPSESADKALSTTSKAAPCEVSIVDADQGILHLEFQIDPYRNFEAVLPSMMTLAAHESDIDDQGRPRFAGPVADATNRGRPISFDAVGRSHINNLPKLTKDHKVSVILTAIPGAPNDERALYCIEVSPQEIEDMLPPGAKDGLKKSRGPIMELYIGSSVESSRVAWSDAQGDKTLIEQILGIGGNKNESAVDFSSRVRKLVLNDSTTGKAGASLSEIAKAAAARLYASLGDRIEGEMAVGMNYLLRPAGWLSEVNHAITTQGVMMSKLSFPEKIPPVDIFAFLDSSTRALILKLASPDKTV